MKKSILLIFLCSFTLLLSAQQQTYSRVKIYTDTKTPGELLATGIEITGADPGKHWYMAEISQKDIAVIAAAGFRYEVIIPDLVKYYTGRFREKTSPAETDNLLNEAWPQPVHFSLGSCGGFCTVDEMTSQLDLMRSLYPSLVSVKHPLNDTLTTIEGRNIYYVRISDNPDVDESEPEVLYTGMHHAREPIGMQHLLYYMWYLLENYNSDPSIKALVDNTEMYFVPVFNVDGYTYNITTNPAGGGLWRKNRRNNGAGSYGVDLNRNYGYKWGYDDSGSSPDPESEIYRGTAPFSEPETRMMKYFCESHNFEIALNYHSYANLFLYAWGWSPFTTPDDAVFGAYGKQMTKENNYTYGPGYSTIYPTNGGSDDWMYGEQTTKPEILSYTPEVGGGTDGFWPVQDRIVPLCQENMFASITAARLLGNYGTVTDKSPFFLWNQAGYLPFDVQRLGMQNGSYTVSVIPLNTAFASVGEAKVIQGLELLEIHSDSISYQVSNTIHVGDTIQYILKIDNGTFTAQDTIMRIFGFPYTVFNDDLSGSANWTGSWGLTGSQYFSPPSCMTDSPDGFYSANDSKLITLNTETDLTGSLLMVLQFQAKWALEKDYDYVQLSISDNQGATWTPLQGKYTHPGTIYQAYGQPVYDGKQDGWVRETISLNEYMGKNVLFRFRLKADQGTEMDGFYFDDFNISMLLDPTSAGFYNSDLSILGIPFPNPASGRFEVNYKLPGGSAKAEIVVNTPAGITVSHTRLLQQAGIAGINISSLAPGIYFVSLVSPGVHSPVRKLVVR